MTRGVVSEQIEIFCARMVGAGRMMTLKVVAYIYMRLCYVFVRITLVDAFGRCRFYRFE
jgi:hypothetical protein